MTMNVSTAFLDSTSDDFNPSIAAMSDGTTTREVLNWAYTDSPNLVATRDTYATHTGNAAVHLVGANFSPTGGSTRELALATSRR